MSWQAYVDSSLVGSGHIDKAAIISAAGDSVWAATSGFSVLNHPPYITPPGHPAAPPSVIIFLYNAMLSRAVPCRTILYTIVTIQTGRQLLTAL
ncbi:profilin, required for normal timing of actin polymerization in response to thermal stress [Diatrype stigma]|uniref:Profilin n=1 Tax=Diatrype stigma TaxID=117547 RepID=A0AAN9UPM6_9PEZI